MSVSTIIHETPSFFPAIPLLQSRELHQENHFGGQKFIMLDIRESLIRANTFINHFERHLNTPQAGTSPLHALLEWSFHLPATEENKPLFSAITNAFFKQKGYFSRLFFNESWEEWFENRTALGKVASQFRNCIESRAEVCSFTKVMNPQLIQKANEESNALLNGLGSREVTRLSKGSCFFGLTSGIAASFLLENPLPLLMGLSACFPRAYAQQKDGNEFQANSYTTNAQDYPSVASLPNGNFVVTWQSFLQDGSLDGVYGQLFDGTGTKIGNEFQANSYTTFQQNAPSAASLPNGNFVVTWTSSGQDGGSYGVYGQLFDGNVTKIGNEFQANSYTGSWQNAPSVASLPNGNFVVTWTSYGQDGSGDGVYGQLFDGTGSKIGNEFRANSYTASSQAYPSVASLPNGNFVVAWASLDQDGSNYGVYGQLFDGNGTKIGNEFQANSYTANRQWDPSVASLPNGNFVVTWASLDQDGSDYGVYGQLFDGNVTKIGNEFQANSYTASWQTDPSVASLPNGNFVVTWTSSGQDGSSFGVYGQLFDGTGTKIGNEFQANSYTTRNQRSPSVASLPNGNFVVTWASVDQDGSDYGVYGQIFHDNITYPPTSSTSSMTSSSTTSTTQTTSSLTPSTSSSTMSFIGRTSTSVDPSSITSSSTTVPSTTQTTSSLTPSTSSSTMSSFGRTRTSVDPSSITSSSSTVPSTTRLMITSNSRATLSATSDPSNRFSWVWFLLGGVGGISCLGLTGYYLIKSRNRKKDVGENAFELGEGRQTDKSTTEPLYGLTPDFVTELAGQEEHYQSTPDRVHPGVIEEHYQSTPDRVHPGVIEEHYQSTPDRVHPGVRQNLQ